MTLSAATCFPPVLASAAQRSETIPREPGNGPLPLKLRDGQHMWLRTTVVRCTKPYNPMLHSPSPALMERGWG